MDYRSLGRSVAARKADLETRVAAAREGLAAMERELLILEGILKAIPADVATPAAAGRSRKGGSRSGRWKPGRAGRPPKWYVERQRAAAAAAGTDGAPDATREKPARGAGAGVAAATMPKAKRPVSDKQRAAMARAREVLAARRAAAAAAAGEAKPE